MEQIAFEGKLDPVQVRLLNMKPGNKMLSLLPRFVKSTEYHKRLLEINQFNSQNRWIKKGLGIAVMEFSVFYFAPYNATVAIYHLDGSVIITHSGVEIGQGES